jgi:hypothetical protein
MVWQRGLPSLCCRGLKALVPNGAGGTPMPPFLEHNSKGPCRMNEFALDNLFMKEI